MTETTRLLDENESGDAEKALLRSWAARQPPASARLRTLATLGVGSALVSSGVASAAGGQKAALATSSLFKWVGLFLGGVAATAGVAGYVVVEQARSREPESAVAPLPPVVTRQAQEPVAPAPSAPPVMEAPAVPRSIVSPPASVKVVRPSGSSLEEEVSAIDRARRALTGADYTSALQLVDAYDARYPSGSLAQESTEIRIEALYRSGHREKADKLAARFLAANPSSPYAHVIRSLEAATAPAP